MIEKCQIFNKLLEFEFEREEWMAVSCVEMRYIEVAHYEKRTCELGMNIMYLF